MDRPSDQDVKGLIGVWGYETFLSNKTAPRTSSIQNRSVTLVNTILAFNGWVTNSKMNSDILQFASVDSN